MSLLLTGKYIGEEVSEPVMTKAGKVFQFKTVAVQVDGIHVVNVEVPKDYKVAKDTKGEVSLPVKTSAKTWDNTAKRFMFVNVKFYVEKEKTL